MEMISYIPFSVERAQPNRLTSSKEKWEPYVMHHKSRKKAKGSSSKKFYFLKKKRPLGFTNLVKLLTPTLMMSVDLKRRASKWAPKIVKPSVGEPSPKQSERQKNLLWALFHLSFFIHSYITLIIGPYLLEYFSFFYYISIFEHRWIFLKN